MLKTIEQQELKRGMYIHINLYFDKATKHMSQIVKQVDTIENVRCTKIFNNQVVEILLYVDDRYSHHHFSDKAKYIMWRKHDTAGIGSIVNLMYNLYDIISRFGIDSYTFYYATTNPGSFYTRIAGEVIYTSGNKIPEHKYCTCSNESLEEENGDRFNGVRKFRWVYYPLVTGQPYGTTDYDRYPF